MSEVDWAEWYGCRSPGLAPDETGARTDHCVAPPHCLDFGREFSDGRMSLLQVGEDNVGPFFPGQIENMGPRLFCCLIAERVVVRPNCRAVIESSLVRRDDVAERIAVVEDIVPREREAVLFGGPIS